MESESIERFSFYVRYFFFFYFYVGRSRRGRARGEGEKRDEFERKGLDPSTIFSLHLPFAVRRNTHRDSRVARESPLK